MYKIFLENIICVDCVQEAVDLADCLFVQEFECIYKEQVV